MEKGDNLFVQERMDGGLMSGDKAEGNTGFAGRQGLCLKLAVGIPKARVRPDHDRRAMTRESDGDECYCSKGKG
jgi:hypothetical protein